MPRVSMQQMAKRVRTGGRPDHKALAQAIAELMALFQVFHPDKDLGHVIANELQYGKKRA